MRIRPHGRRARRAALTGAAGFTLIELLVAIAILAVVALLSWRGLDQIIRGRNVITQSMAEERVFAQMVAISSVHHAAVAQSAAKAASDRRRICSGFMRPIVRSYGYVLMAGKASKALVEVRIEHGP